METAYLHIEQSPELRGQLPTVGAKNAVLVIMASLLLTRGKSRLYNVPGSSDVLLMSRVLEQLGATVTFFAEEHCLEVDTTNVNSWSVPAEMMQKMRASILVMGPLLARFGRAQVAVPGGCVLGARPIDYHLKNFMRMGAKISSEGDYLVASAEQLSNQTIMLDYPSVGATENIIMAATLTPGITRIVNAALEPEVFDLISILTKMGAQISILPPATIEIEGVLDLQPVTHEIIMDRLEAGALLCAAAITGGQINLPHAPANFMEMVLYKFEEMGHTVVVGKNGIGVELIATKAPKAVSFKTGPYPSFPTDLQAPFMAMQTIAEGRCVIEETVFENRMVHVRELQKMGAQVQVENNVKAIVTGVDELYGAQVIASDIRASCALVLAGMVAKGTTIMTGIHHWQRGYEALEEKLMLMGAKVRLFEAHKDTPAVYQPQNELEQSKQ